MSSGLLEKVLVTSSVNDELDSFYNKIQTGKMIEKQVSSFFYPKLTDEEIKLVENKDKCYLRRDPKIML